MKTLNKISWEDVRIDGNKKLNNQLDQQPRIENYTLPIKADEPPSLEIPTATLAGAPPGAFLKAGASASDTPPTVGTKSISNSPKQTTSELVSLQSSFVKSLESPAQKP